MSTFDKAVDFVLEQENGYSMDTQDPGGETMWGISKRAYPEIDIVHLTREAAAAIYKRDYWDKCRCDELPSWAAILVFDAAVNQGTDQSIRQLQAALNVHVDGIIGPQTILSAHVAYPSLAAEIAARRMFRYGNNDNFARFGLGWSRRLMRCYKLALET